MYPWGSPVGETTVETTQDHPPTVPEPFNALTARELQVAIRLATGATNSEIADELDISGKTVDTHRMHVMKKLQTRNNVALARMALRVGLTTLDEK
jgi:DNA-binding NarL/FixJ family response regulator